MSAIPRPGLDVAYKAVIAAFWPEISACKHGETKEEALTSMIIPAEIQMYHSYEILRFPGWQVA